MTDLLKLTSCKGRLGLIFNIDSTVIQGAKILDKYFYQSNAYNGHDFCCVYIHQDIFLWSIKSSLFVKNGDIGDIVE